MTKLFSKIKMFFLRFLQIPRLNDSITVYIPSVGKCYKMVVSGIKFRTFTARWEDDEPDDVDMGFDYGQIDNDIEFYIDSRTPVDKRKNV